MRTTCVPSQCETAYVHACMMHADRQEECAHASCSLANLGRKHVLHQMRQTFSVESQIACCMHATVAASHYVHDAQCSPGAVPECIVATQQYGGHSAVLSSGKGLDSNHCAFQLSTTTCMCPGSRKGYPAWQSNRTEACCQRRCLELLTKHMAAHNMLQQLAWTILLPCCQMMTQAASRQQL